MTADNRYQVFISATYPDMQAARQALMLPLMDMGLIPTGFDSTVANGNTLMPVIQRMIEECDYFIILVGGRYGTLSPMGLSEIHREYIFAATKRKPVMALIHDNPTMLPDERREMTRDGQVRREDFARLLEKKTVSHRWTTETGLSELIKRAMPDMMREHPADGWIRADRAGDGGNTAEATALKQRIAVLEKEREEILSQSRPPLKSLARGADQVSLDYSCNVYEGGDCKLAMVSTKLTWDQAFACVAPLMLNPASETALQKALEDYIGRRALADVQDDFPKAHAVRNVVMASHAFNQVKIHLRALGLINKSAEKDSRGMPMWQLTAHGDNTMSQIMAVRRSVKL
ncbi:MAG: DUF4062 domain-containing protein [Alcanivorax sp.]|nr:DUF4062 domain-containing protein [Alcanivorax sp.]